MDIPWEWVLPCKVIRLAKFKPTSLIEASGQFQLFF